MKAIVNFRILLGAAQLLLIGLLIQGCTTSPLTAGKTLDQKAYALYGTFVVFEEQAASLIKLSTTPDSVKEAIRKADRTAKPVADELSRAVRQYLIIQRELSAGTTTNDKLVIATANLEKWVRDATPLIESLVKAVGGK